MCDIHRHYNPKCIICGAEFPVHGCGGKAKTCSPRCRQQAYRDRKKQARAEALSLQG